MAKDEETEAWSSLILMERLCGGDDLAAGELFDRYFERLSALARGGLSAKISRRTDADDIVQSAYRSFFIGARGGRFTLGRGGDLWRLLAGITRNKLLKQVRRQQAVRRAVGSEFPLDGVAEELMRQSPDPSPEEVAALADELEWAFTQLDAFGRRVLELRLQGLQLAEIAEDTGRSERTVRRSLAGIRTLMAGRIDGDG